MAGPSAQNNEPCLEQVRFAHAVQGSGGIEPEESIKHRRPWILRSLHFFKTTLPSLFLNRQRYFRGMPISRQQIVGKIVIPLFGE